MSGVAYSSPMPAFRDTLSDADIANIINYERSSWGNHGKLVTAAQIAAGVGVVEEQGGDQQNQPANDRLDDVAPHPLSPSPACRVAAHPGTHGS